MESDFSERIQATRVAVLNLSTKTGGNAIGLGNADIRTERVFQACFTTLGPKPATAIEAVLVRDTRHVNEFLASAALLDGLRRHPLADIVSGPIPLSFDAADNLVTPWRTNT